MLRISASVAVASLLVAGATAGQEMENRQVVVRAEAEELPSAYGAPPDLSHGRISTLTKSYVLSPFSFELEAGYEGSISVTDYRLSLPGRDRNGGNYWRRIIYDYFAGTACFINIISIRIFSYKVSIDR